MPKREDIKKVLVIGQRPHHHRPGGGVRLRGHTGLPGASKEEGIEVVLVQLQPGDHHDGYRTLRTRCT